MLPTVAKRSITQSQLRENRPASLRILGQIVVFLLLLFLGLPVFLLGSYGIYALIWQGYALSLISIPFILPSALVLACAFATFLSFRYALLTAAALAVFYIGWAVTVFPHSGFLPQSFLLWVHVTMLAILSLNMAWIIWPYCPRPA